MNYYDYNNDDCSLWIVYVLCYVWNDCFKATKMTIFHNNVSEIKDHTVRKQVKEALKASDNIRGFCNQLEVRKVSYNIVDKIGFVVRIDGFAASEEEQGETDFSPMPVNHTLEFLKIQNHKIWS